MNATAPPTEEVEVLALVVDHPALIASPEADKAFCLLTDARLRDMYSAALKGQAMNDLVVEYLPPNTARDVLSGKYATEPNPSAHLAKMIANLLLRAQIANPGKVGASLQELRVQMQQAQRRGDRETASLIARLVEAQRKGDHELASQLATEISSNRKQVD